MWVLPIAVLFQEHFSREIRFSGYSWHVKRADHSVGPGPNIFSDAPENVSVDSNGTLHMKVRRTSSGWSCAEIVLAKSLGYGTYSMTVEPLAGEIDRQVVLGLFTWSDAPEYAHRELDFELGLWGQEKNQNAQFVVQPYDSPGHIARFDVPIHEALKVSIHWIPGGARFAVRRGSKVLHKWNYSAKDMPVPGDERFRINLWLFDGKGPQRGKDIEMRVSHFRFRPKP